MENENTCKCCEEETPETKLLEEVYKNTKMASEAITSLLSKVEDGNFRQDLTSQLTGYQGYSLEATRLLLDRGRMPEDLKFFEKLPAVAGLQWNTARDRSVSKLSELMINGSTMGIIEMRRALRQANEGSCGQEAVQLGDRVIRFEEDNIERLKTYL